ncbi:MAG: hypothetical protein EOO77_00595 [Oxalobacteraceae bacterium]|nr:MAG: hypothetical protein EOO77_00595 [Oxalobacteraceae bacterium]
MTNPSFQSKQLADQLPADVKDAMRKSIFTGYGWALIAPLEEISELLVKLKLVKVWKGQLIVTNRGMIVRAIISREMPSAPSRE